MRSGPSTLLLFFALTPSSIVSQAPPATTVAIPCFEHTAKNAGDDFWIYYLARLLSRQMRTIEGLRPSSWLAIRYAYREMKLERNAVLDAEGARRLGRIIEAQWVFRGQYHLEEGRFHIAVRMVRTATKEESLPIRVQGTHPYAIAADLIRAIAKALDLRISKETERKLARHPTKSEAALAAFARVLALHETQRSRQEITAQIKKALRLDPDFIDARAMLAGVHEVQGRPEDARKEAKRVIELDRENSVGLAILGRLAYQDGRSADGRKLLLRAWHANKNWEALLSLGRSLGALDQQQEALVAFRAAAKAERFSGQARALIGRGLARLGKSAEAQAELAEGLRLEPDDADVLWIAAQTYSRLGDVAAAVSNLEEFLTIAIRHGVRESALEDARRSRSDLLKRLKPHFKTGKTPRSYTAEQLRAALRKTLSAAEFAKVHVPFAANAAMREWAGQLTEKAETPLAKARELFDALAKRIQGPGVHGTRTALEVFAAWQDPEQGFNCQEFAKLFLALARTIDLPAFYVHLERDYRNYVVYHDCCAVFVGDKLLLVDPAYNWFGADHKDFVLLDDLQAVAHHFFQGHPTEGVARCRIADTLHPNFTWGRIALGRALIVGDKVDEAQAVADALLEQGEDRWDIHLLCAHIAQRRGDAKAAREQIDITLEKHPRSSRARFALGRLLLLSGDVAGARREMRLAARYELRPAIRKKIRRDLAILNDPSAQKKTP